MSMHATGKIIPPYNFRQKTIFRLSPIIWLYRENRHTAINFGQEYFKERGEPC